jgi:L-ascorbate metabolism protein UlaG (beta-lactamase superfamily)
MGNGGTPDHLNRGQKKRREAVGVLKIAVCGLLLSAQIVCGGLEKYSALVVADSKPETRLHPTALRVTYLGVNGYQFELGNHVLLVDPYFTRVGLGAAAFNQKIESNPTELEKALQHSRPRADAILVTHAHFDHLLDVPPIMRRTRARLVSGPTAVNLVEACGIPPDRCDVVKAGCVRAIGPWEIGVYNASHDHIIGNSVPYPGTATGPTQCPSRPNDWKVGEPLAFVIQAAGKKIYVDSGGVPGNPPDATIGHVDLAILGVALPDSRQRYPEAVRRLNPRYVLPSHQDDFFAPFDRGFVFGKFTDFPEVLRLHKETHLPGRIILLDYFHPWTLPVTR